MLGVAVAINAMNVLCFISDDAVEESMRINQRR